MRKCIMILSVISMLLTGCKTPGSVRLFPTATPATTTAPEIAADPVKAAPPTPTPLPTPTSPPAMLIQQAEENLFLGNYEQARREFQDAGLTSSDPAIKAAASVGMARALYLADNYSTAIDILEQVPSAFPDSPLVANAYFYLAQNYEAQNQYDQAAEAYAQFLKLRPGVLDAYMQELRGDALIAAGNPAAAVEAFSAAVQAADSGASVWTELKLGKAYAAMEDFTNAITTYLHVYENSDNDYARAQANLLMGQAYMVMGEHEQAHTRFLDSVANFPKSYDTYSGLVQLVNDMVPVNELSRGIVDYYAGQYGLAVDAFTRYIEITAEPGAAPYHYRALSRMAQNQIDLAIADWNIIITSYPTDALWPSAWDEKAYAQWAYLDDYDGAAQTLLDYVAAAPESTQSPEFLFMAARILERTNRLTDAAVAWESIMEKYPSSEKSYRGLFLAGVTYYRTGDYPRALTVFQRGLVLANDAEEQSAAYLWMGKSHLAAGDPAAAQNAWRQGAQRDPTGYYSERANELLLGKDPFIVSSPVDLGYDLASERGEAEAWLRETFNLPAETDLNGLGELESDPKVIRGRAFWELGLHAEARDEFESLRKAYASDPVRTYRLMNAMLEMKLYRSAVLASRQVLDLASMDDAGTLKAPAYFNHIRFGVYFKDQVLSASQKEGFHPLFLLSLLRQESLFESFASSGAGARGLMQIMPATGHEIASSMNWPEGYGDEDLYRPAVSIVMGTRYLARQRDYFDGSMYAALAAYNGGPGNTGYWKEMAGNDPDLLLEVIRADETRSYIMQIYEFFNIYRLLYMRGM